MRTHRSARLIAACLMLGAAAATAAAQTATLNLYTARHYQTDDALYANFTKQTGIRINRIEGAEDPLMERIRNEGANSPADVFITVDVGRLWRAEQAGIFGPVKSALLESRVPAQYRDPQGHWFGFSARARIIVHHKRTVKPGEISRYEDLADPKFKGRVCTRSGGHVYNLSLMGAMIGNLGEARAEDWARGVVANLARSPRGGDTDQLKAVAAGECDVAISNTYYYARLMRSEKAEDRKIVEQLAVVWPNQADRGTHMNISGGGMVKTAPHRDAAVKFLEYLASDDAQRYFADGNNEWPVVASVKLDNPALKALGTFKVDPLALSTIGRNQPLAQKIFDRAGFR